MKEDLFKKLGEASEQEILRQKDLVEVMGGTALPSISILSPEMELNALVGCPGNVCDPTNCGGCPGNTVLGGSGSCPL